MGFSASHDANCRPLWFQGLAFCYDSCGISFQRSTLMKHPSQLRLAMAQINVVVGDIEGNAQKIIEWIDRARDADADIVTFPELALTGYPPEDLLLKPQFIDANLAALDRIISRTRDITAIVGFVDRQDDIFNAAAIAQNGKLVTTYHKMYLPNYGVFSVFT